MVDFTGYAIAIILVALYIGIVVFLYRTGRLGPDRRFSLFGPLLMVKTHRGRSLLDRLGRFRRAWSALGDAGLVLAAVAMIVVVVALLIEASVALRVPSSAAPSPTTALGLPGINPFIPIGYGLVAIAVGIIIHELFHGIVARSQNIGVKSLGVLFLVVPIGAFVEQDDKQMQAASRRLRGRVAAAGILANFLVAAVTFLVLGLLVSANVQPNATGVGIAVVEPNTPAANVSLQAGDIITAVNGTQTPTDAAFLSVLEKSRPNQMIPVTYYSASQGRTVTVFPTLATYPNNPNRGFLGVAVTSWTPSEILTDLRSPWASSAGPIQGFLIWLILPFAGLEPVAGSTVNFYHLAGPLAGLGVANFWVLTNLIYWLTWMNLLLGLSNALPLIPLDGGLLFRDWIAGVVHRIRKGLEPGKLDDIAARLTVATSLLVVFLIVWQFLAPRL